MWPPDPRLALMHIKYLTCRAPSSTILICTLMYVFSHVMQDMQSRTSQRTGPYSTTCVPARQHTTPHINWICLWKSQLPPHHPGLYNISLLPIWLNKHTACIVTVTTFLCSTPNPSARPLNLQMRTALPLAVAVSMPLWPQYTKAQPTSASSQYSSSQSCKLSGHTYMPSIHTIEAHACF